MASYRVRVCRVCRVCRVYGFSRLSGFTRFLGLSGLYALSTSNHPEIRFFRDGDFWGVPRGTLGSGGVY